MSSCVLTPVQVPTGDSLRRRTRLAQIRKFTAFANELFGKLKQAADDGKTNVTVIIPRKYQVRLQDLLHSQHIRTYPPVKNQIGDTVSVNVYWQFE